MSNGLRLRVNFYKTESGNEPVREWLRSLPRTEKKIIGEDIKTVQYGWPLGMPLVRKIDTGLWEVRSELGNRIARVLFTVQGNVMLLLHGFIKKSQKMPASELRLAKQRLSRVRS
jgi:phage-related protein